MKERRRNPGPAPISVYWFLSWMILLAISLVLWVTEPQAQGYGSRGYMGVAPYAGMEPYGGYLLDIQRDQRIQTEIMLRQERREQDRDRQDSLDRSKARAQQFYQDQADAVRW